MDKREKCLEYYLDSRIYDREAVEKSIEQAKREFPEKEVDINIYLNEWGVYVITLYFRNKNNILKIVNDKIKPKNVEYAYQLDGKTRKYGQYKKTGTYRPF